MRTIVALVLCFYLFVTATTAQNCGGNCPGNDCPSCPCGTVGNPQNIAAWCAKFTGWDQTCCQCIMSHESGGNANAINYNDNGSYDVGLWQINDVNWGCNGGTAPCDPNANLQCAIAVWKHSNSFREWSTCGGCGCCGSGPAASTSGSTQGSTQGSSTGSSTGGSSSSGGSSGGSSSSGTGDLNYAARQYRRRTKN